MSRNSSGKCAGHVLPGLVLAQVVGGAQAPSVISVIEKAVIAQVIIGVGDEDIEDYPPPRSSDGF
jgi:hypothetical protein